MAPIIHCEGSDGLTSVGLVVGPLVGPEVGNWEPQSDAKQTHGRNEALWLQCVVQA